MCRTVREAREFLDGRSDVGFVPTMGAFHEGHLDLMRASRAECAATVVSIYVNPLQFGPQEDLARYPRDEERDLGLARDTGVDMVFLPAPGSLTEDMSVRVSVGRLGTALEGAARPGHFDGVATVVLKLFEIVRPRTAFFGLKDLQQCAVVRRMVSDLELPVGLRTLETVREESGLALSSRNAYLSANDRMRASALYASLTETARQIGLQEDHVLTATEACSSRLTSEGFQVDYVALVDPETMEVLTRNVPSSRVVGAVKLSGVRLIDNVAVPSVESP